jgi:hypothetical protein
MINFFRKIRRQLANENKFQRYMRYAIGEVILIMLGIFMALQLNNWNENRKQEAQFKVTLEQLFSSMSYDVQKIEQHITLTNRQIENMDFIYNNPDSIPKIEDYLNGTTRSKTLPYFLNYIAFDYSKFGVSETKYHAENLSFNPDNKSQNQIFKHVINYVNEVDNEIKYQDYLNPLYYEYNIASPKVNTIADIDSRFDRLDSLYYKDDDILSAIELINSNKFRIAKNNTRNNKVNYRATLFNRLGNVKSILQLIKNYYPEVKVLYQDVGIIGTSLDGFDDVGGKSTPMVLTDIENDIWQIDLYLKEGRVKFRCRDSWAQNWGVRGNNDFPKGKAVQDGADIDIPEAGNYHIIFKPITGEFEFIKQDDQP